MYKNVMLRAYRYISLIKENNKFTGRNIETLYPISDGE